VLAWIIRYRMPAPELSLASIVVHFWLPLFALPLLLSKLLTWLARATIWA